MKKIIDKLINESIQGVNIYSHNRSIWLIIPSRKEWVIELDKNGVLYYNHYFFSSLFNYVSLDVIENQHYIAKWVEDTLMSRVSSTHFWQNYRINSVADTIQNGVKNTLSTRHKLPTPVKIVMQDGIIM